MKVFLLFNVLTKLNNPLRMEEAYVFAYQLIEKQNNLFSLYVELFNLFLFGEI